MPGVVRSAMIWVGSSALMAPFGCKRAYDVSLRNYCERRFRRGFSLPGCFRSRTLEECGVSLSGFEVRIVL